MGARRKTKQNPAMVESVEIPDAEHELVVERAAAIDVAKATGKVCVRLPGKSGRRFSRVWDVPARTGAITELAEQLVKLGIDKVTVESTSDYCQRPDSIGLERLPIDVGPNIVLGENLFQDIDTLRAGVIAAVVASLMSVVVVV